MLRRLLLAPVLGAVLVAAACGEDPAPAPDVDAPAIVSESFVGTISVNGAFTHPFTVARAGSVTAQILALTPDDTVTVGLVLGTWNGSSCQQVIANDAAKQSSTILGTATTAGTLCVRVYDVGGLSAPTDYEVKVDHY